MSDAFPRRSTDLDWLLAQFIAETPNARSAVVASTDGVRKHTHGLSDDDSDRIAVVVTGLVSVSRGVGQLAGPASGPVAQVIVQFQGCYLFVVAAGAGTVLGVVADAAADPGQIGNAMTLLVRSIEPFLTTPARSPRASAGTPG
ncbi:roadblock/LC7 domain-containing protein [Kitasatospora sp. NBC_00240]|uniref:roadblock/LC7 domain-containing protein n=1 Tax=Kitasatospora sp. NBC_00240 TaxID=2903567 RepID=UPI002257287E|nr:roadblock/LC7 domain-containing protein [Kitasatospora sp. NBC_00240]MCX5215765.1 roadblock/LC7 domain-containing protein [Kitasatospora sp. NBC_00240]